VTAAAIAPTPRTTLPGILGVIRAPFLPLAVLLALSGSLAQGIGALDFARLFTALIGLVAAHALVNVLNELSDDRTGIDHETVRTPFSGGSGALQAGLITRQGAQGVALVSGVITLAAAVLTLGVFGEWRVLAVIAAGAACIFLYTPWLLNLGVGELAAGLGLGGLPVIGAAMLQGGPLTPAVWVVAVAATAMTFNLLLYNTIPDMEPDRKAGRKSLVLRIGVRPVAYVGLVAWGIATAAIAVGITTASLPPFAWLAFLPGAAFVVPAAVWTRAGAPLPVPVPVLGANVVHNLGTHAALVVAFVLSGFFTR
jgi:1,4-dihydroxy-2-naphthoate octaprenyltransferase